MDDDILRVAMAQIIRLRRLPNETNRLIREDMID